MRQAKERFAEQRHGMSSTMNKEMTLATLNAVSQDSPFIPTKRTQRVHNSSPWRTSKGELTSCVGD